ncbi:MoxR family ATPase [bacterium]|jgi:MoxR-like ATPase|nr:MoxR family ATPase [bacterium]MBT3795179.1 MoxR family ATPase [bacterium]MBT4634938.1 MoxR family ATPase [bacterium]
MSNPFELLRTEMDELVIGHSDVKTALLLGIISREHIYIQGPPGTAKTMLSEIVSKSAELSFFFYQMHRDTRLSELVGDLVISREDTEGGEIIRQNIIKGGILTSEICLLDDISRAPGESLNVLLRILNERKYGDEEIPLLTAIATSNPTADEYYNEPLDPANLDRFVIQINSNGLSYSREWEDVKKIVNLYSAKNTSNGHVERIGKDVLDKSYQQLEKIIVPSEVQDGLISFISWLIEDQRLNESNSVISDRTFLVKSIKIIKASAVLAGRSEANLEDLKALKYILAFRVPEEVLKIAEEKLESIQSQKKKTKK